MLNLWRNPPDDGDNWIGFTSYRQLDKTPVVFHDEEKIIQALESYDVLAWHRLTHGNTTGRKLLYPIIRRWGLLEPLIKHSLLKFNYKWGVSIARQAEKCHPGIMAYVQALVRNEDISFFWTETSDFYGGYWIMNKELFYQYMDWIYPFIKQGIKDLSTHPYLMQTQRSPLGYVLERLFCIGQRKYKMKILDITDTGL